MKKEILHGTKIKDFLLEHNKNNLILTSINEKFPKATLVKDDKDSFSFAAKEANGVYTHLEFEQYGDLWVYPSHQYLVDIDGVDYNVIIKTKPSKLLLIRRSWGKGGSTISFSDTKNNFKKNNFDVHQLFKDCKSQILKYLSEYPNDKIDNSKIDKDIQKILTLM